MRSSPSDTPPAIEERLLEGYRSMSPREKLNRVVALNHTVEALASARLRAWYGPDLSDRELRLRLGALRLGREVMVEVFDWDPDVHGL